MVFLGVGGGLSGVFFGVASTMRALQANRHCRCARDGVQAPGAGPRAPKRRPGQQAEEPEQAPHQPEADVSNFDVLNENFIERHSVLESFSGFLTGFLSKTSAAFKIFSRSSLGANGAQGAPGRGSRGSGEPVGNSTKRTGT